MQRGEIYRIHQPPNDTKKYRAFVIVSRQSLIDSRFSMVICAPVYTNGQGLATQVNIGPNEGLKHDSWIHCDNLASIPKSDLTQYVGSLSSSKLKSLGRALQIALDLF